MNFHAFDILFIGFSFAGIVVGSMILSYRSFSSAANQLPPTFMGWIIVLILHLSFYILHLTPILTIHHTLNFWGFPLALLHLPLLYLSIRHLALNNQPRLAEILLHTVPYFAYVGWLYFLASHETQHIALSGGFFEFPASVPKWFRQEYGSFIAVSGLIYSLLVGRLYVRFRKEAKHHFSNPDTVNPTWILFLSVLLIGLFLGTFLIIFLCASWNYCPIPTFKGVSMYLAALLIFFSIRYQQQREILLTHHYVPPKNKLAYPPTLSHTESTHLQSWLNRSSPCLKMKNPTSIPN